MSFDRFCPNPDLADPQKRGIPLPIRNEGINEVVRRRSSSCGKLAGNKLPRINAKRIATGSFTAQCLAIDCSNLPNPSGYTIWLSIVEGRCKPESRCCPR